MSGTLALAPLDQVGPLALLLEKGRRPRAAPAPLYRRQASEQRIHMNSQAEQPTQDMLAAWLKAVAARQDRDAFARLHGYFAPRLVSWLTRSGLSYALAEELSQEALLSVWRKAALYSPEHGAVTTWIFVIARNLRTDHQRRKTNRETASLDDWDQIDDSPTGEEVLVATERETRLRTAMSRLPREQAVVLEQAYFAEKPQSEIARELNVPLGTVKSRVRLALAKLKSLLESDQ
jgi:RNA polymerase sigma-70 factor (ECF subfamily)